MRSMRALSVRSSPAFKELSALARITCAPTPLERQCAWGVGTVGGCTRTLAL